MFLQFDSSSHSSDDTHDTLKLERKMRRYDSSLQEMLLFNSEYLDNALQRFPSHRTLEVAETFFNFYLKHGKTELFLQWAIKKEVESVKSYGELFREDRISMYVIQRAMFDDIGIKFLKTILSGIVKDVISHEKPLLVKHEPHLIICIKLAAVDDSKLSHNIKHLLAYTESFLSAFSKNVELCPILLRELFFWVHREVSEKFFEEKGLFVLYFIFFCYICPVLVNPKKYEIVKNVPENALAGLVNASKILNDLALNSVEKQKHPKIADFIQKQRPKLVEKVMQLIDENDMDISLKKATSLVKRPSFTDEDRQRALHSVAKLLNELKALPNDIPIDKPLDSEEEFESKASKWLEKLNNPRWRLVEKKQVSVYSLKEEDTNVLAVKSVVTVMAPPSFIKQTLLLCRFTKEWNPMIGNVVYVREQEDYEELIVETKLPFPFKNRDTAISVYNVKYDENHIAMINDNVPPHIIPSQPDCIRTLSFLGGWDWQIDTNDSSKTIVTYMVHADARGSLPVWLMNSVSISEAKKVHRLKKLVEQKIKTKY